MENKILRAYILDDEMRAIELLRTYISKIDFLELLGDSRSPVETFKKLQTLEIDILFLDINMPLLSGVELYKSLENPPLVIFTTAYPEYAVDGFDLAAVDYLLKPISFSRFFIACQRVLKRNASIALESNEAKGLDIVYVKSGKTSYKLFWKDILYLEKNENYIIYHTKDRKILSRQTMSNLEEVFPSYIIRAHKSYAISFVHLKMIKSDLVLIENVEIPVGRKYKSSLHEQFEKYRQDLKDS